MQVPDPDSLLQQVVGQILGHPFRERRDQNPLVTFLAQPDLSDEVVDLPLGGLQDDLGIQQSGGSDHLFDDVPCRTRCSS